MLNKTVFVPLALLLASSVIQAAPCEDIHPNYRNGGGTKFGPYDYNAEISRKGVTGSPLQIVEQEHFTEKIRTLKGGNTSLTPGGDLSYTLWAFPNHHQALVTLINYTTSANTDQPPQMRYSAECYFKHAVQWRPNDAKTRLIFGMYLYKNKKIQSAIEQFAESVRLDPDSGNAFYNLGLAYFENKDYDKALDAAHAAYALGFGLDGLKNKLARNGRWKDAPPPPLPQPEENATLPETDSQKK
jgi:hypothetical protein